MQVNTVQENETQLLEKVQRNGSVPLVIKGTLFVVDKNLPCLAEIQIPTSCIQFSGFIGRCLQGNPRKAPCVYRKIRHGPIRDCGWRIQKQSKTRSINRLKKYPTIRLRTEGSAGFPLRGPRQRFPRPLYPITGLEPLLTRQARPHPR